MKLHFIHVPYYIVFKMTLLTNKYLNSNVSTSAILH